MRLCYGILLIAKCSFAVNVKENNYVLTPVTVMLDFPKI